LLTKRQGEFLNKVRDIFQKTGHPVHYIDLAQEMGVSKWTAYDVLSELERKGFVRREYSLKGGVGRSQVLFLPVDSPREMGPLSRWKRVKEGLLAQVANLFSQDPDRALADLLKEMPKDPLLGSAYALLALLTFLRSLGQEVLEKIKRAIIRGSCPEKKLFLVTGTGLGLAAQMGPQGIALTPLFSHVQRLQDNLERLSGEEHRLLHDFFLEVLERVS